MSKKEQIQSLLSAISEAEAKMILVQDYLDRFKISDMRLLAPVHDIDRCISHVCHIISTHIFDDGDNKGVGC